MNTLTLCEKLLTRGESNLVDGWKASKLGKISKIAVENFHIDLEMIPVFSEGAHHLFKQVISLPETDTLTNIVKP